MSDILKALYPPIVFADYRGALKVAFLFNDRQIDSRQACGIIPIPDGLPIMPRVVVQAIDNKGEGRGIVWTFEQEIDHGRGAWVTYDPDLHEIPTDQALVDAGTESDQLESSEDEVELSEEAAPTSDASPSYDEGEEDDYELDEPSDEDEDDEDEVTAD